MAIMKDVYTKLKFLKFRQQLDALENGHLAPPVHVRIKPMNPCDHDCWYCAYHVENLQLGNLMEYKDKLPREKMMEIVNMKSIALRFAEVRQFMMFVKNVVESKWILIIVYAQK